MSDLKDKSTAELRAATLGWINKTREENGLETLDRLPEGLPGDSVQCVVARAMADLSDGSCPVWRGENDGGGRAFVTGQPAQFAYSSGGERHTMVVPPLVAEFARRFDEGQVPDLAIKIVDPSQN